MANEKEIRIALIGEADVPEQGKPDYDMTATVVQQRVKPLLEELRQGESEYARRALHQLLEQYLEQEEAIGSAVDFHNLAVELGRVDEYLLACRVLKFGFRLFPRDVDLLADFLQLGVNCSMKDECQQVYETLMAIPRRRWTWRGFSFTVDYLKHRIAASDSDEEIDQMLELCHELAMAYRKCFPRVEGAYRTLAGVYELLNMYDEEIAVLEEALGQLHTVPGCALRYADIMFEQGKYTEAADAVRKALNSLKVQNVVNSGYLYYLRGLCGVGMAQEAEELPAEKVEEIYASFNTALRHFRSADNSFREVICTQVWSLEERTRISVNPERFDQLFELVSR